MCQCPSCVSRQPTYRLVRYVPWPATRGGSRVAQGTSDSESYPWEKSEVPDVKLAQNRAACHICLEQFTEPNRAETQDLTRNSEQVTDVSAEKPEPLKQLPCRHVFHQSCVDQWLNESYRCPVCRKWNTEEPSWDQEPSSPEVADLYSLNAPSTDSVDSTGAESDPESSTAPSSDSDSSLPTSLPSSPAPAVALLPIDEDFALLSVDTDITKR